MQTNEPTMIVHFDLEPSAVEMFIAAFERDLESGKAALIEDWMNQVPPEHERYVFEGLLRAEIEFRRKNGHRYDRDEYLQRFPAFGQQIFSVFDSAINQAAVNQTAVNQASISSESLSKAATSRSTKSPYGSLAIPSTWTSGRKVGHSGRYRLDEFIGRGGFGEVWRGYDSELDRVVAIKVPRIRSAGKSVEALTFRDEARRAAKVKHEGIVEIYDIGEVDTGFFIVSELIDGPTLANYMKSSSISHREAVRIVRAMALILDQAHRDGLFHRDVKPSNILIRKDGSPVITDFGLAVSEEEQLSLEEGIVGTLAYMSPEQARGETRLLDGRSDLYSLGVILFQLLTGRLPFLYKTESDLLQQIVQREARPLRSIDDRIPTRLDQICRKCLAKDVRDRYSTGSELAADLEEFVQLGTPDSLMETMISNLPLYSDPASSQIGIRWKSLLIAFCSVLLLYFLWSVSSRLAGSSAKPPQIQPEVPVTPNALVIPPETMSRTRLPLFDEPVEKAVVIRTQDTDFFDQDIEQNVIRGRAEESSWILTTRHLVKPPLQIRGQLFLEDWVGTVGFIWGYSQPENTFPKLTPRCFACVIERFDQSQPLRLSIREIQTSRILPDLLSIKRQDTIKETEISIPLSKLAAFEIEIDDTALTIRIDQDFVWQPEIFDKEKLEELKTVSGNLGILIRGKTILVSGAEVTY